MSGGTDRKKLIARASLVGLIVAVVATVAPLLGGGNGLLLIFTLPLGIFVGLLVTLIIVSIVGISRAWRTSTVHRVMTLIALALVILATVISFAWPQASQSLWGLVLLLTGFVGLVMFIITGFTGLGKKVVVEQPGG